MSLEKAVYTAHAKATGGRDGRAISNDQILDVQLAVPKEMGDQAVEPILNSSLPQVIPPVSWVQ